MSATNASEEFLDLLENEESYMARWCEVADFNGVRFYRSQVLPIHLFNFASRLWRYPNGASLLERVGRHFGTLSLPHRLFLGPKEPQHLASFFVDRGYVRLSERLMLAHDLASIPQGTAPHMQVKSVSGESDLREWVRIALESWQHPDFPQDFGNLVSTIVSGGLADGDFTCYLAACGGDSVGTGLMNRSGLTAGIHAITTAPAARGQGVASAIVARILADAAEEGYRIVCLQTGKGDGADMLYKRMGFRMLYTLAKYGSRL